MDTQLLYRAVPSWFITNNRDTYWVLAYVYMQEMRFHNWLRRVTGPCRATAARYVHLDEWEIIDSAS